MALLLLQSSAWVEYRGRPTLPGLNQTTHQAIIVDPSGQHHKCYVKAAPVGFPTVFAEAVGWLIAEALDLPRPKFAAIVMLPLAKLRQSMPLDQHWLRYPEVPAFCSSVVDGKHLTSRWKWVSQLQVTKAFKAEDVARIAAFDAWVENQDRHSGNLLRTKDGRYIPIDNEAILYSLIWETLGITFAPNSLRLQAKSLLKAGSYRQFEARMILSAQKHASGFNAAWPALDNLVRAWVPDPLQANNVSATMRQFLAPRAHSDWLPNQLGQIP